MLITSSSPFLQHLDHEQLWVLVLDTRNRFMSLVALYKGSVNSSQVRVAEVFRQAILENAPAIILAHNHPSGDPTPSPFDGEIYHRFYGVICAHESISFLSISFDSNVSPRERQKILHINKDDIAITRCIREAGDLLDIQILDHLVVGLGRFVSLKERGLGFA